MYRRDAYTGPQLDTTNRNWPELLASNRRRGRAALVSALWGAFMLGLLFPLLTVSADARTGVGELAIGDQLPELRGEFLTGKTAVLPQAASGRVALLMLGFTYDSRFQVEAWAKAFRRQYEADPRVTFFEIPMIGGMARLGKWFIDSGMRRGTPRADYEHVITVYGGTDVWKQRLGFQEPKAAYLILMDQQGRVVWRHAGGVDDQTFQSLMAQISDLP